MNGKRYSTEDIIRIIPCRTVKPYPAVYRRRGIVGSMRSVSESCVVEGGMANMAGG